jgi:hypothetical protein
MQLRAHLVSPKPNGVTETELKEVIVHLAFYVEVAASHVGDHSGERGFRFLSPDVVDQLGSRRSTKGSPGAKSWMRSGFSTRPGNESGSALNGGKSGASTQPQWYSSNGVCG